MNKEMMAALEADGEKLRALTGEDHGPVFLADDDEPEMDPDEAFLSYECGMMPNGQCTLAGTEACDWECPRSR